MLIHGTQAFMISLIMTISAKPSGRFSALLLARAPRLLQNQSAGEQSLDRGGSGYGCLASGVLWMYLVALPANGYCLGSVAASSYL